MLEKLDKLLVPGFLRRLDHHLLLNYRLLWTTRLHYIAFYGVIGWAGMAALMHLFPVSPAALPSLGMIWWAFFLIALVPTGLWVYRQLLYNIESNFGRQFLLLEQSKMLIYVLTFSAFLFLPITAIDLMKTRLTQMVSPSEFAQDVNLLEMGNPYFPTGNSEDIVFERDKSNLCLDTHNSSSETCSKVHFRFNYFQSHLYTYGSDMFKPTEEISNYFVATRSDEQRLTDIRNFIAVADKYGIVIEKSPEEVLKFWKKESPVLSFETQKYDLRRQMMEVSELQRTEFWEKGSFLTFIFMVAFSLANALMVYQHVGMRTFIFSAISGIAIILATSIAVAVSRSGEEPLLAAGLGWFVLAFGIAMMIRKAEHYSRFKAIALVLATVTSPLLIFWLRMTFGSRYGVSEDELSMMMIVGALLHFMILVPVYKSLYLKLKSVPVA